MRIDRELLKGATEMAVLQVLSAEAMYGYHLAKELERRSEGILALGHGTLYPLLYNLEGKGLISAVVRPSDDGPPRKYYSLTPRGRARLTETAEQWTRLVHAMSRLFTPEPQTPALGAAGA